MSQESAAFLRSGALELGPARPAQLPPHSSRWCSWLGPSSGMPVYSLTRPLLRLTWAAPVVWLCLTAGPPSAPLPATAHSFPDQPSLAAALLNFVLGAFKELVKVMHQLPGQVRAMGWHCQWAAPWPPKAVWGPWIKESYLGRTSPWQPL